MIVRVSVLQYDPAHRAEVERLWLEVSRPTALAQKGNLAARACRSAGSPGELIMIVEWESPEDADAFVRSPEHQDVLARYAPYITGPLEMFSGELVK